MIAANIMTTGVFTLTKDRSMLDAAMLIREKRIRQIPVVDEGNRVLGIVTPRSIMKALLPRYMSEGMIGDVRYAPELPEFIKNMDSLAAKKIEEVIDPVYTGVGPETSAMEVAVIFISAKKGVESILVVDDQKRLLGIISPWDVFKRLCEYIERKKIQ